MPKKVDHFSRRASIAAAVWQLMARGGLEAVSMRHVAAGAGMSLGQVQHYFPTKDELLAFAYELVAEQVAGRVRAPEALEPTDEEPRPRDVLRDALTELLPLDEDRELEAQITVAFLTRAAVAPELATRLRKAHAQLQDLIADQLRRGQRRGVVPLHLEPGREARTLLSFVDGLTAHVLVGHHTPEDAEQAFDDYLDTLFTG
ncbi:TetR/AcrR family transcriptional regulator [Actinophytocola sp.]|uniref:TetR/AcrR family transcriptional regulator n=1 Tax=Actinophytocola sp. TaxID=1872138 RepID=UPI002ED17E91